MNTEDLEGISKELEKELSRMEIEENNKLKDEVSFENEESANTKYQDDINIETKDNNTAEEDRELIKSEISTDNEDSVSNEAPKNAGDNESNENSEDIEKFEIESIESSENDESITNIDYINFEGNIEFNNYTDYEENKLSEEIKDLEEAEKSEETVEKNKSIWRNTPLWVKVSSVVFLIILSVGITGVVYLKTLANKMQYENPEDIVHQSEEFDDDLEDEASEVETIAPEDAVIEIDNKEGGPRIGEGIINILLIGEDRKVASSGRGPADAILVATINKSQKTLKLTSIMRDSYVSIPGYNANKINAAFSIGGAPLLASTIEQNFDIKIDGYASVHNASFETIINKLGGVDITLTSAEASYLNRTNYISNKAYRNVREGRQTLNGNQALGYARVRYIGNSDFERTNRQKRVLLAVFDKYKSASLTKILETVNYTAENVTTNMQMSDIIEYATIAATLGATEIETFRIPVDNAYADKWVGRMQVLMLDFKKNTDEFHKFLFGEEEIEETTIETSSVVLPSE